MHYFVIKKKLFPQNLKIAAKFELKKLLSKPKWKGGLFFLYHNVFIHARIFCHNSQPHCIYLILLCLQWQGFKRISFLFQPINPFYTFPFITHLISLPLQNVTLNFGGFLKRNSTATLCHFMHQVCCENQKLADLLKSFFIHVQF